jgi:formate dehydrogenase subunit gamma
MQDQDKQYIKRFGKFRIIEHWLNAVAFILLVLTGLSQKFHGYDIYQWLVVTFGGIDATRIIHRYSGITLAVLTANHILLASVGILFMKWQPTMIIQMKDFRDAIDNIRYYMGLTEHAAKCDRFDYKQKFEYWGVVVGGILMVGTGLSLWFPTVVTKFLPGQLIPVAKVLHSNEALLAFLVIVIWHIYNAIFSPEVFPIDTVIFSGKISRERMIHEHPVEYERMFGVSLEEHHPINGNRTDAEESGA